MALLYLTTLFIKWNWLDCIIDILIIVTLVLSMVAVHGTSRIIGYSLFIIGAILLYHYHVPLTVWGKALRRNLYLLVMFTLVPLLGIPIRQGGYIDVLKGFFRHYVRRDNQFYLLVKVVTFLVGVMINVAVVPLVHQISLASEKSKNRRLLSTALIRGFAASIIWNPGHAAVALTMELTGAKWLKIFPYGLLMSFMAIFIGWLMTLLEEKNRTNSRGCSPAKEEMEIAWNKIVELSTFGLLLIATIVIISLLTGITTVVVVAMVSLVFPIIWLTVIRKLPVFVAEFKDQYFKVNLPRLKNEVVLFLGAGFFSTAVSVSHWDNLVSILLQETVAGNAVVFSLVVISLTVLLAMLGIHPIITVTILGSSVRPEFYNISRDLMALILTSSWSLGIAVSPSSGLNVTMSGLIERSPLVTGPRWNGIYAVIVSVIIILILNLLNSFGLV
ncbi:hypothetical protein Desmer_2072 [Calderihabitans maritimus]|uniref:Uncharacterized protein n=1 Tax=Calderihabitans maritimus TaxID=1246530 RepID=A0A1Z5HWS4_9FIRM|nr:hypothetical protein Desmer_2072 [Calderihabitans maritimus]